MTTLLTILGVALVVFVVCVMFTDYNIYECIRSVLIALVVTIIATLPVGEWEEFTYADHKPIESTKCIYVVPCEHCLDGKATEVRVTPIYTWVITSTLCDDLTSVAYCTECHTRKESIKTYLAQR